MKITLAILALLLAAISAQATSIYTANSPSWKHFIALVYEEQQVKPIYVTIEPVPPEPDSLWVSGDVFGIYRSFYESEFPSILLGRERAYSGEETMALSIAGKDAKGYQWVLESNWIWSRFLGWVYAGEYPVVFSNELGWVYIVEGVNDNYDVYVYQTGEWQTRNLKSLADPYQSIRISAPLAE